MAILENRKNIYWNIWDTYLCSVENWGKLSGGKVFLFVKTFENCGEKMLNLKMRILGIEEYLWSIWDVCLHL